MDQVTAFVAQNTPPLSSILTLGPVFLVWSYFCLSFAGFLKSARRVKTGYTRKTFHILTFLTAAVIQFTSGFPIVCLFGIMTTLVLAYALARGEGHPLFEAIAREKDEPHRVYYIIVPYFATLIGGAASSIFFGPASLIGYLVGGLGDAAGEPVGTRWGKHQYVVPTFSQVKTTRSIEGSIGVLVASLAAIVIGVALSPDFYFTLKSIVVILGIGVVCALLEAVSPHGWDNATMQLCPALLAATFL